MNILDVKRKKLELARVQMARNELEFKIEEKMDEVSRIKHQIGLQLEKEEELKQEIAKLEE
jgi:hypothetical protein